MNAVIVDHLACCCCDRACQPADLRIKFAFEYFERFDSLNIRADTPASTLLWSGSVVQCREFFHDPPGWVKHRQACGDLVTLTTILWWHLVYLDHQATAQVVSGLEPFPFGRSARQIWIWVFLKALTIRCCWHRHPQTSRPRTCFQLLSKCPLEFESAIGWMEIVFVRSCPWARRVWRGAHLGYLSKRHARWLQPVWWTGVVPRESYGWSKFATDSGWSLSHSSFCISFWSCWTTCSEIDRSRADNPHSNQTWKFDPSFLDH